MRISATICTPSQGLESAENLAFSLPVWLQAPVEDAAERVRATIAGASDLQAQQRSCSNAWDLYRRTRPAASPESAARARTLGLPGPHPLLAAACPTYNQGDPQAQVLHPALSTCSSASSEVMPSPNSLECHVSLTKPSCTTCICAAAGEGCRPEGKVEILPAIGDSA